MIADRRAAPGFFVVPMNALLQHRGHVLMGAGHSIAVQNFNENIGILVMLGALRADDPRRASSINTRDRALRPVRLAATMLLVLLRHRRNQAHGDSLHLIGVESHGTARSRTKPRARALTASVARSPLQARTGRSGQLVAGSSPSAAAGSARARSALISRDRRLRRLRRSARRETPLPSRWQIASHAAVADLRGECRGRRRSRRRDRRAAGRRARRCSRSVSQTRSEPEHLERALARRDARAARARAAAPPRRRTQPARDASRSPSAIACSMRVDARRRERAAHVRCGR